MSEVQTAETAQVYVDDYRVPARVGRISARWSHMMADDLPTLLAFADRLGLRRAWLQDKASGVHFDVTDTKRDEALRLGAIPIECGSEQWSRVLDEARQQFSGEKRPRRFPVPTRAELQDFADRWVETEALLPTDLPDARGVVSRPGQHGAPTPAPEPETVPETSDERGEGDG